MWLSVIGHLVAHARGEGEPATVFQLRMQFALQAEQHVAFLTPAIGQIIRGVLHHAHPHRPEVLRAPEGFARDARMLGGGQACPVGCREG